MIQLQTLCEGCEYWHRVDTDYAREKGGSYYDTYEGDPAPPLLDLSVGVCSLMKHEPNLEEHKGWSDNQPRVVDGSQYFAAVWTKATYGCILGKPILSNDAGTDSTSIPLAEIS